MRHFAPLMAFAFMSLVLLPPAAANYHAQGTSPLLFPMRGNPQIFCWWVLDDGSGRQDCYLDYSPGTLLTIARIQITNGPASVHLGATRYLDGSTVIEEQIAVMDCSGTDQLCENGLISVVQPAPMSGYFGFYVTLNYAAPGTIVQVSLET